MRIQWPSLEIHTTARCHQEHASSARLQDIRTVANIVITWEAVGRLAGVLAAAPVAVPAAAAEAAMATAALQPGFGRWTLAPGPGAAAAVAARAWASLSAAVGLRSMLGMSAK